MKQTKLLFFVTCIFLISQSGYSQETKSSIAINYPTIEQEATSIWRTINDIEFLEGQGYKINLPNHSLIDSLIVKSKKRDFGSKDFSKIYNLLESEVYEKEDYVKSSRKVSEQIEVINNLVDRLRTIKNEWDWGFKMYELYTITPTLYGTGGSYNADEGSILLFVTADGAFMNYENPANTIIHEIVHIGVEESLVQKYNLEHSTKENLVDSFVCLMFKDLLHNYRKQNMGVNKIDQYLIKQSDLKALPSYLNKLTGE